MGQVARDTGIRNTSCPTRLASDNTITRNDSHGSLFLPRLETYPRSRDNGDPSSKRSESKIAEERLSLSSSI